MLPLTNNRETFKILSVDPGSSNLGFSFMEYDFETNETTLLKADTIIAKGNDNRYRNLIDYHEERQVRLLILKDSIADLLKDLKPNAVVAESNYMGRFVSGFVPLVECVLLLRMALYEYDQFLKLYMVDPSTVKINIGMKRIRGTTKDDVKKALIKSKKINFNGINPNDLDEHAIDAVAIGIWYVDNML